MAQVQTVLGNVDPSQLGRTLVHEQILAGFTGWQFDALAQPLDRKEIIETATLRLAEGKNLGFTTFVDVGTADLQRDASIFPEISRRSGATSGASPAAAKPKRGGIFRTANTAEAANLDTISLCLGG